MKKKITIVGAGISGLYLAFKLQEYFEVTILEARERLGGRIFSIEGHDMGPSWIWQHHTKMLALVNELGLELFAQYRQGDALYDTIGKVERFTQPIAPSARVKGSLSYLVNAFEKHLEGTEIIYHSEVKSIVENSNNVRIETQLKSYMSDIVIVTLPPRVALGVEFFPELPQEIHDKMKQTQTWMGNSAKCVVEFATPFWKERGLSGFVFSNLGPLSEIHDASTFDKHALFGFVSAKADMSSFYDDVRSQMQRLFGKCGTEIKNIFLVDWREEQYTAVLEDRQPLSRHHEYGIETNAYSKKVYFSATEFSFLEGGYLDGALQRADIVIKEIMNQHI